MEGGTSIVERVQISLEIGMIVVSAPRAQQDITLADIASAGVIRKGN